MSDDMHLADDVLRSQSARDMRDKAIEFVRALPLPDDDSCAAALLIIRAIRREIPD